MSEFYSDDEDFDEEVDVGTEPMVVEVRGRGTPDSPLTARRSPSRRSHRGEDYDSEEDSEEDYDEGSYELITARSGARSARRPQSRNVKTTNGKKGVNMTPPDQLLEKALKKAKRFSKTKKADKAIKERIRILALTRIVFGSSHWKLAQAHVNLAEDYLELKDKAVKERIRILALTRIVFGSSHWKLAQAHVNLAEDYLELKGYTAQAEYHTENAMSIMLNSITTTTTEREKADVFGILFTLNYIQGKSQIAMKKYGEAETALLKADRAYQACSKLSCVTDDQCDDMEIKLTQNTARLSWRQKKYAVAGTQFDKVIDLTRRRFGDDAIELIPLYQESGRLEQSKGRHANHDKAIEMFLQAHSIAAANYKYASEEIVDTALALAQAYANTGREEAEISAESYLNECLSSCQTVYGPLHKKTLEVQDELARLLIRTGREGALHKKRLEVQNELVQLLIGTGREGEALEILRSTISTKNDVYGDYSEPVADTHKLIGSIHLAQGNIEKALRSYKKCHDIEALVLGKGHKKTKDSERTIDILMASPGLSKKFVLNKEDELKKRPRFNAVSKTVK